MSTTVIKRKIDISLKIKSVFIQVSAWTTFLSSNEVLMGQDVVTYLNFV